MNKPITARYFREGDRILATLSPENKDSIAMLYQSGSIHEFEVGEQTLTGYLKLRYISDNGEPGLWFWLTHDGKNAEDKQLYNFIDVIYAPVLAEDKQLYNFIDVIYAPVLTEACNIACDGLLETGTTVNWPETSTKKVKEPVTVEGEFKVMKNCDKVKTFTGVGAQCDEEAPGIIMNFDHSLENRIGK